MKNAPAMSLISFPTSLLAVAVVAVLGIVNARAVITVDAADAAALNEVVSTSTSSTSSFSHQKHGLRGGGRMMTSREPIAPTAVHGRDRLGVSSGSSSSSSGPIGVGDGINDNSNNTDELQQQQQQQQQQDDGGCTTELLTSNARTSVEDQYFTYSGPGQLDFNDETTFIGDILQFAVFAAYRDEIQCVGDGSSLQLDSSFFMFGYDMVTSATTAITTPTAASDNGNSLNSNAGQGVDIVEQPQPQPQPQPVFNHSFFLMTFNMACNACEITDDDCGIPVFTDDENIVDVSFSSGEIETPQVVAPPTTTEAETGCFCRPPSRQAFLRNLNERLQQNPNGLFDGIIVDSVAPIMVTPEPASSLSLGMVSRSSPGLGKELPIVLSSVPSHCQQQQQQQQKSQGIDLTAISMDECTSGRQVIKIVHNLPTLFCLES
eukprot:CAMPEP_0113454608 /NCGR_PEP_ID=MMETSP0014_2-20120614/7949_1 /TAXON_ID=2857 /ORGANISM="Nitzschia sp." /LENGTH=432 /DNA_ID=CAMNT_0000346015 /DNA_START=480 /DNA_END=1778 /DNA_ORIENTATION=+ /assembly_acc=CAM_ASM_000159